MENYDLLVQKVAETAGLAKEDIERKIEAKKASLSGLISKEGAAQIVAAELNVNFEDQELKINELMAGMKKANVVGKIVNIFPVREFERNGKKNKVANLILADDTGNTRVVLWDTNHIAKIENGELKQGDSVSIRAGSVRDGEIHLSSFSELEKSDKVFDSVKTEKVVSEKEISDLEQGQSVRVRGIIVQMFQPRFFYVCPECGKKATQEGEGFVCQEHGKVSAKERAILNFVIDDGTENTRVVLFSDQINKLIQEEDLKDTEKLTNFREDVLGSEMYISGSVRKNKLFGNIEIIANDIEKADVDKLIEVLESSS